MSSAAFKFSMATRERCWECGDYKNDGPQPYHVNGKPVCSVCIGKVYESIEVVTSDAVAVRE